jgi:paraquat-inducible protein B
MKHAEQAPEARIQARHNFSIVWVVPIIALLIGGWMAIKAWSEKGPEITITFESAEGLEANKTKIKFKDVEMGTVTEIRLKNDLSGVIVTAEMARNAEDYLTEQSKFWVVRARVAAGEVSGLGTLFSGAYIGCIPSKEGKPASEFVGFEKPPVVTTGLPGRHFMLAAETLGSLDVGSPVYYRGIKVGQIVGYEFDADEELVNIRVFVSAPYHEKVMQSSRFWNVSGINFTLDTEGVKVDTQSLVSIMLGGVAFDLPEHLESDQHADQDRFFKLYANHNDTKQKTYTVKRYYLMYFDQSVRGLSPGAPVEIKGIKLGEVLDVKLVLNSDDQSFRVAILVMVEPERIDAGMQSRIPPAATEGFADELVLQDDLETLVNKGLRAQLKTGNLLTGQLYVDLDFYPAAPPAEVVSINGQQIFPTIPAPLEQIAQRVDNILDEFEKVPFEKIGKELREAISALTLTLGEIKTISGSVNRETLPRINTTLEDLQGALKGIEATIGEDSALSYNARMLTDEFLVAVRSLRSLLDYLEREPQALIFGKEGEK